MNETTLDKNGDTISEAILRWLEANPSWWSRAEIALGVGRSKTSQFVRAIESLTAANQIERTTAHEHGRDLYLYRIPCNQWEPELPF